MKTKKICSRCNSEKELNQFAKRKISIDGYNGICRICRASDKKKHRRSKYGVVSGIYQVQVRNSKQRGHNPPEYTKQEFVDWMFENPDFFGLYSNWVDSGYDKDLKPSVDRLDDYKGYSMSNIQLMTWKGNREKYYSDVKNGINTKDTISVSQHSLDGKFIDSFYSMRNASDNTGVLIQSISRCIKK